MVNLIVEECRSASGIQAATFVHMSNSQIGIHLSSKGCTPSIFVLLRWASCGVADVGVYVSAGYDEIENYITYEHYVKVIIFHGSNLNYLQCIGPTIKPYDNPKVINNPAAARGITYYAVIQTTTIKLVMHCCLY
jgi:hypothetical protein